MKGAFFLLVLAVPVYATAQSAQELNAQAVTLSNTGRDEEALALLERAWRLEPRNRSIAANLGITRLNVASLRTRAGEMEAADLLFRSGLPLLEDSAQYDRGVEAYAAFLANWGRQQMERGERDAAIETLLRSLEYDETLGAAHWFLGNLYYQASRYEEALYHLDWALEQAPEQEQVILDLMAKVQAEMQVEGTFATKSHGDFTVSFEGAEQRELADMALRLLRRAHRDVGKALGVTTTQPIEVKLYTAAQFAEVTLLPDWVPGVFDGKIRLRAAMFTDPNDERLRETVYHEYAHVLIYRESRNRAPVWLHEGLAQCLQRSTHKAAIRLVGLPAEARTSLAAAVRSPGAWFAALDAELQRRQDLPTTVAAYQQAESFVSFLVRQRGYAGAQELLAQLAAGKSPETALAVVYSMPADRLLAKWLAALEDQSYRLTGPSKPQ